MFPSLYEVELADGTRITAPVQGSGGIIRSDQRLRWVIKERREEAADKVGLDPEASIISHGASVLVKHAGTLSLWTAPDAPPAERLTTVDVLDVVAVRRDGDIVWPRAVVLPAPAPSAGAWAEANKARLVGLATDDHDLRALAELAQDALTAAGGAGGAPTVEECEEAVADILQAALDDLEEVGGWRRLTVDEEGQLNLLAYVLGG